MTRIEDEEAALRWAFGRMMGIGAQRCYSTMTGTKHPSNDTTPELSETEVLHSWSKGGIDHVIDSFMGWRKASSGQGGRSRV